MLWFNELNQANNIAVSVCSRFGAKVLHHYVQAIRWWQCQGVHACRLKRLGSQSNVFQYFSTMCRPKHWAI